MAHHITQRGNDRRQVFVNEEDYRQYLSSLHGYARETATSILAYCLMSNHLHIMVIPDSADALSAVMGRTDQAYTRYFHHRYGTTGHLWQMRFYSCPVDDSYLWTAMRYVERNPVRAQLVTQPWEYPWSSARAHVSGQDETGILDMAGWAQRCPVAAWRAFCASADSDALIATIREQTESGYPLATEKTLQELEENGIPARRPQMGRPRR